MGAFDLPCCWLRRLCPVLILVLATVGACAVETDNFFLPLDGEFADLGGFLEAFHTRAIEASVDQLNSRIERALNLKDPKARRRELERWHSPDALADAVADQFGDAPLEKARIEGVLNDAWARQSFPDQTIYHHDISMNLRGRMLLDPRGLLMFIQSPTIKAYGVYFGTDKLVHIHQVGPQYYKRYRAKLREGLDPEEARRNAVHYFAETAFLAEGRGFGTVMTGVYSNADMAANYVGFTLLLNLTEPVLVQGHELAPLVVRCGVFWRLNDHVRLHSGWFRPFLSDHLNEALNPNLYDSTVRPHIQRILQDRAGRIVEFYTKVDGRPENPEYYEQLARDLSTFYGEAYGHSGQFDKLMNLGNTCIPALQPADSGEPFEDPDGIPSRSSGLRGMDQPG